MFSNPALDILLVAAGAVFAVPAVAIVVFLVYKGGKILVAAVLAPTVLTFELIESATRSSGIQKDLDNRVGPPPARRGRRFGKTTGLAVASHETKQILALGQMLRETVFHCNHSHWHAAEAMNAEFMYEAAGHDICDQLRNRTINILNESVNRIRSYPMLLTSPQLTRTLISLESAQSVCPNCIYVSGVTVADAPQICPMAEAIMRGSSTGTQRNPKDAAE